MTQRFEGHSLEEALTAASETLGAALDRLEVDSSLAEMEQRYRTLIEQARDMFVYADVPDEDDRTIYVSPQIEHILGVTTLHAGGAAEDQVREQVRGGYALLGGRRGQYALGNVLFSPAPGITTGVEFQWGNRENFTDGYKPDDFRIQFSFKYNFGHTLIGGH